MSATHRRATVTAPARRRGMTLLELIVALAVVAILAAGAAPMLGSVPRPTHAELDAERVARARTEAIRTGRSVSLTVMTRDGAAAAVLARPDGIVLGAEPLGVDVPLGRPVGRRADER